MKTAISIPDSVFAQAEESAKELNVSRSELYTTALREFLGERSSAHITERLNQIYDEHVSILDPSLTLAQTSSLSKEEW